eukprot:gene34622-biopygen34566
MYRWSLDLAWPSKRVTRSGNSRVLIMTEHYTMFIVCMPIPDKEASTIAAAFRNYVLAVFGAPAEYLVDGERVVRTIKFCFKKFALEKGLDYEWDELLWSL